MKLIHQSIISALMLHNPVFSVQMRSALPEVSGVLALELLVLSEDPLQFHIYFYEQTILRFSLLAFLLLVHHKECFIFNINIFIRIISTSSLVNRT